MANPSSQDSALLNDVLKALHLDEGALQQLRTYIRNACLGHEVDSRIGDDVFQEAIIWACRQGSKFKEHPNPFAYLCWKAKHICMDVQRKEQRRGHYEGIAATLRNSQGLSAEIQLEAHELRAIIATCIAMLSHDQKIVVELRLQDYSYDEIATRVPNIPSGTLRSRVHDGMIRLRQLLTERGVRSDYLIQ